jgi:phosphoglycolate phosphatase
MQYKAVIFDLDGTLLDTLTDISQAANRVLSQNGFPTHPIDAYRGFIGDGVNMLFRRALPDDDRDTPTVSRCAEVFPNVYRAMWNVHTKPFDGITQLLDELTGRSIQLAVLSNKPHEFTRLCVQEYLSDWEFAAVYGQREGIPRKPAPVGAISIADELGQLVSHCVFLGDSAVDMQTAHNAGMLAVGAVWGFRTRAELEAAGANHVIEHPGQLVEIFE